MRKHRKQRALLLALWLRLITRHPDQFPIIRLRADGQLFVDRDARDEGGLFRLRTNRWERKPLYRRTLEEDLQQRVAGITLAEAIVHTKARYGSAMHRLAEL